MVLLNKFFLSEISKINIENYKNPFLTDFDELDRGKLSRQYGFAEQNLFSQNIENKHRKLQKSFFDGFR